MTTARQIDDRTIESTIIRLQTDQAGVDWISGPVSSSIARQLIEWVDARLGAGTATISSFDELIDELWTNDQPNKNQLSYRSTEREFAQLVIECGFAQLVIECGFDGWMGWEWIPSSLVDLVGEQWLFRLADDLDIDGLVIEDEIAG